MTARAFVERDLLGRGVRLSLSPDKDQIVLWGPPTVKVCEPGEMAPEDARLFLPEESARAVYEALAEWFGHTGHDMRALRRDYDDERKRVDQFINHLTNTEYLITTRLAAGR